MTFEQAFSKIKEKFNNADATGIADFAIQITFTDEDCGGTFYAEVRDGKLNVEPYDYYDNNAVLNISKSALLALLAGRVSLDKALANGDAYVQGDVSKITDWKKTINNSPAKKNTKAAPKTSEKKTEEKKSAKKKTAEKKSIVTVKAEVAAPKAITPVKTAATTATTAPSKASASKKAKKN